VLSCTTDYPSKSCILLFWQRYCTALEHWASAKLCGDEEREPPMLGRTPSRWASAYILLLILFCTISAVFVVSIYSSVSVVRHWCNVYISVPVIAAPPAPSAARDDEFDAENRARRCQWSPEIMVPDVRFKPSTSTSTIHEGRPSPTTITASHLASPSIVASRPKRLRILVPRPMSTRNVAHVPSRIPWSILPPMPWSARVEGPSDPGAIPWRMRRHP